ncbi:5-formyltetrahydrofolate cyclo-ligase [Erythrobacter sp. QSSC1-22B]|uniref:5-formyltetrahydrofolate cyclo-ligase n=1 Tax=Erythrobacter sp. QSSC1-22B TaxID=1860125 RepID=UPI000804FD91|nr:5-formyltetrahydrofolate cyclo-ligase [Erythrobacter sp. QSSC1-22B]OBX18283.1 5-formyltetrahydrofolate cyclo-ligase [Erythrobacter sp. QSSC1-22B]
MPDKSEIRTRLRALRREHVQAIPAAMRALILHRPPAPLLELVPADATIGLYRAGPFEAPATAYAKFFFEAGHTLALPRFATRNAVMEFAHHDDPFEEADCEIGPFGLFQPLASAGVLTPDLLFVPLIGFTDTGARIGQGGGHYDRWLADHPGTTAIGLAWDVQKLDEIPQEAHDMPMTAVVTPTRFYGPF